MRVEERVCVRTDVRTHTATCAKERVCVHTDVCTRTATLTSVVGRQAPGACLPFGGRGDASDSKDDCVHAKVLHACVQHRRLHATSVH